MSVINSLALDNGLREQNTVVYQASCAPFGVNAKSLIELEGALCGLGSIAQIPEFDEVVGTDLTIERMLMRGNQILYLARYTGTLLVDQLAELRADMEDLFVNLQSIKQQSTHLMRAMTWAGMAVTSLCDVQNSINISDIQQIQDMEAARPKRSHLHVVK